MSTKPPNPIDQHVGSRVRLQRILRGLSQEKLGEALGVTFQQVQKYEKGANRIGASRLQQISKILDVPPSFFFEGLTVATGAHLIPQGFQEPATRPFTTQPASPNEGLQLSRAFMRIRSAKIRKRLIDLAMAIAEANEFPLDDLSDD